MKIRGYSWAGAPTSDFDRTNRFFREDLGLEMLMRDDERMVGIFKLPTGQLFEVFGPGNRYQKLMNSPAIAFDVDDIDRARAELEAKGVKFVSEIERGSHGDAWTFFEGPDGYLYQLFQRSGEPESKDAA
ncbi:MAG TPA: VOC family protein [Anaerolineales bacterium]|nr:VOC family protein [Anaerolineales bacterium]